MVEKYVIRLGRFLIAVLYNFYLENLLLHCMYESITTINLWNEAYIPTYFPEIFKDEMLPTTGLLFLEGRILS